ncbi:hypothetical protein CC86DRAFT_408690 [Ophiobolus disseminans]|uniref:Uncharacterized protein n=1 Tax=Ophiobolus disseminans TaxID=1469910 RepID=A0A6A6ZRC8_9PLEO|nr:hypothetical protein CC86DRAFT_408690 [Ophiobolus disseminans]
MVPELLQHFQVPGRFLSATYRRSNGFFGSAESVNPEDGLNNCCTWFCVIIKDVSPNGASNYSWRKMTFWTRWNLKQCSILCIGADRSFRDLLQETLSRIWTLLPHSQPYALHVPIVETIVTMQDLSVWSVRDFVRSVEQKRSYTASRPHDFLSLHEASRHAIHSMETLGVTVDTISALQQHASRLPNETDQHSRSTTDLSQIQDQLAFQVRILQNMLRRSQSNKERLQNEIALAYSMIAQRDSQTMTALGEAAKRDSEAMRTIAVVTMAFLPPTFLSASFSTSFFNYTPGHTGQGA